MKQNRKKEELNEQEQKESISRAEHTIHVMVEVEQYQNGSDTS